MRHSSCPHSPLLGIMQPSTRLSGVCDVGRRLGGWVYMRGEERKARRTFSSFINSPSFITPIRSLPQLSHCSSTQGDEGLKEAAAYLFFLLWSSFPQQAACRAQTVLIESCHTLVELPKPALPETILKHLSQAAKIGVLALQRFLGCKDRARSEWRTAFS